MSQPSKTPMFFRPTATLPSYATAQMTIINPVPVLRPCPPLQWAATAARTPTPGVAITYPTATPIPARLQPQPCRPLQSEQTAMPSQTWQTFHPLTVRHEGTQANNTNVNLYSAEITTIKSPRATTAITNSTTNIKSPKNKNATAKKFHSEKANTDALQETIHRQRELIGKLISVIVKDRLKNQDKPIEFNLKDGEVSEVEKLLNLTDSLKNSNLGFKSDKTATISFSSGERKRRTRTATGEKKRLCKRLRKDRKSPKQTTFNCQQSGTRNSSSIVATVVQSKRSDGSSSKIKALSESPEQNEDIVRAATRRVLNLMHPNGDSQLFSLRVEFARQLKSLEEDFQHEYEAIVNNEEFCDERKSVYSPNQDLTEADYQSANDGEISDDSDWLPSSAASSSLANRKSTSLSSDSSGESYSIIKKKFPKRKHVRCYKPQRRNKKRQSREKSRFKPIAPRRASGMALQKIDRMLRNPETVDGSNDRGEGQNNFHERALYKIRQSMALWRRMSMEMNSFLLSDDKEEIFQSRNQDSDNANSDSPKEGDRKNDNIVCVARNFEEDRETEALAELPNNKTDPTFMLSKFFQFLPEQHEVVNYVTEKDATQGKDVKNVDDNASQHHGCLKRENSNSHDSQPDEKSVSDIFKSPDGSGHDDVDKESTNQSAPFLCQFNYTEASDPDIIGEVIVVTTDENASAMEKSQTRGNMTPDDTAPEAAEEDTLLATTTEELFPQNCSNEMTLQNQTLFEDLPPPRELSSPSSVIRLDHYQQFISDDEDLPKFELPSYPQEESKKPLVQMFRPLNPDSKDSDHHELTSPSEILITNVVSLNPVSEAEPDHKSQDQSEARNPTCEDRNSSTKSESDQSELKKDSDETSETLNKSPCTSGDADKNLARPLKKLISNIKLNCPATCDANVVEWGLVPRRAMHLAKQRIQEQLCGGEKSNDDDSKNNSSRRFSLRSHSGSGDCVDDDENKKNEKKRNPIKKTTHSSGKRESKDSGKEKLAVQINLPPESNPNNDHGNSKESSDMV